MVHKHPHELLHLAAALACFSPVLTAFSAFWRQSGTALVQLSAALRLGSLMTISSLSMMQGGTASEHFFKQTLAGGVVGALAAVAGAAALRFVTSLQADDTCLAHGIWNSCGSEAPGRERLHHGNTLHCTE